MKGRHMIIKDTLWPWKALRELRSDNRGLILRHADDLLEIESLRAQTNQMITEKYAQSIRISYQKDEIVRLNEQLKLAVFRDPKTGRLSKKAKV